MIYVLQLQNGKYYIGKSNNVRKRIQEHKVGDGAEWTKIHKVLNIVEYIDSSDNYDEDKYTLKYMKKYGIDNVRGGSFCSLVLNNSEIETITKMNNSSENRCFECGKTGHYAKDCWNNVTCYKCKEKGHYANRCNRIEYSSDNGNDSDFEGYSENEYEDILKNYMRYIGSSSSQSNDNPNNHTDNSLFNKAISGDSILDLAVAEKRIYGSSRNPNVTEAVALKSYTHTDNNLFNEFVCQYTTQNLNEFIKNAHNKSAENEYIFIDSVISIMNSTQLCGKTYVPVVLTRKNCRKQWICMWFTER
jgi:hypothetical protein